MKTEIFVKTKTQPYKVLVGKIPKIDLQNKKVLIVTSSNIASLYLDYILPFINTKDIYTCIVKDGDIHKNMDTIEEILKHAFEAQLNRNSVMIAIGGGVITDMVGFASGIFQRGIDFISIPTTLLGMVDASVGGKCGINNEYGKNLIGLFHQPKEVFIDSMFLRTLPSREVCAGIAEIIKIFACFDYAILQNFDIKDLEFYIQRSIELKAYIVEQDEKEKNGLRALLNYGHTFGHAIELENNFKDLLHGEAVSIGIVMANRLSVKMGLLSSDIEDFLISLLNKVNLPTQYKIKNVESFYNSFFFDKKSLDSTLHFILLESKGIIKANIHKNISKELLFEVLNEFA